MTAGAAGAAGAAWVREWGTRVTLAPLAACGHSVFHVAALLLLMPVVCLSSCRSRRWQHACALGLHQQTVACA